MTTRSVPIEPASGPLLAMHGLPAGEGRIRILQVVNHLGVGGTEYGALKVMTGLGDGTFEHGLCAVRGFDPEIVRSKSLSGRFFLAGKSEAGFQFSLVPLARVMRAFRPHIVHSRNWGAIEAIPAARLAGVPVAVHSEHGYEMEMLGGLPWRQRWFRRLAYGMADAVLTVTEDLRVFHARSTGFPKERIRVLPNGVNSEQFAPRPEAKTRARSELGLPAEAFVVGTVGRLVPIKDHLTLLHAVEMLVAEGIDAHAVVVGSGPEWTTLRGYAAASVKLAGRALFLGASDRIPDLLNAMDVFALPSVREGMSNTVLEAMSCGLPVVATRVGGNPELVSDGNTGWLFEPRNAEALAECLRRLAMERELRRCFGAASRRRVLDHFSLEQMLRSYRDLYLSLAGQRGIVGPAGVNCHVRN